HPRAVGGVAREAAADLIEHAAAGHPVEREDRHLQRVGHLADRLSQHELERHRLRELGGAAETSPARIERMAERLERLVRYGLGERLLGAFECTGVPDRLDHAPALDLDLIAPRRPPIGDAFQHLTERWQRLAWLVREVRAGVEGL